MGEFKYLRIEKDEFGRKLYICKCSRCGKECGYGRITETEPTCIQCRKIKYRECSKKSRLNVLAQEYERGYADAIKEYKKRCIEEIVKLQEFYNADKKNRPRPDLKSAIVILNLVEDLVKENR